jgi:hypothetical protein
MRRQENVFYFAEYFKTIKDRKFGVNPGSRYFRSTNIIPIILSKNIEYIIVSNNEYSKLYNSSNNNYHYNKLIVYDKYWIEKNGYIDVTGVNSSNQWAIVDGWVLIKIVVPGYLIGQEALMSVNLRGVTDDDHISPSKVRLTVYGQNENAADTRDWRHLSVSIPSYLTEKGLIIASVLLTSGSDNSTGEGDIALERVDLKAASQD